MNAPESRRRLAPAAKPPHAGVPVLAASVSAATCFIARRMGAKY